MKVRQTWVMILTGKDVRTRYQGKWIKGTVKGLDSADADEFKKLIVAFEDDYVMKYSKDKIQKKKGAKTN